MRGGGWRKRILIALSAYGAARGDDDVRGRLDPFARVGDAGVSADGADDTFGRWGNVLGLLDDQSQGEAEIPAALREKTEGMGVAVDGGASGELEFVGDAGNGAPVEESFLDGVALRVLADAAAALVVGKVEWRVTSGEWLVANGP